MCIYIRRRKEKTMKIPLRPKKNSIYWAGLLFSTANALKILSWQLICLWDIINLFFFLILFHFFFHWTRKSDLLWDWTQLHQVTKFNLDHCPMDRIWTLLTNSQNIIDNDQHLKKTSAYKSWNITSTKMNNCFIIRLHLRNSYRIFN